MVSLLLPPDAPPFDSLCFTVQVPGSYERRYYAKFVRDVFFITTSGDTVFPVLVDSSVFKLDGARHISWIFYDIISTQSIPLDSIPAFSGTRFSDSCWQINPCAVFGFIPSLMDKPIRIVPAIPKGWSIGTALSRDHSNHLYASNFFELFDSPILAGHLSFSSFLCNNRPVFIHTYSENPGIKSYTLTRTLKKAVREADGFIPSSAFEPYTFLLNVFSEKPNHLGAHEHERSSIYSLYATKPSTLKNLLGWMARHELFHRTVPLSLQSIEINENRYIGIHPVSHLWFYEGLAQWAAFKMQLMNGSLSMRGFCNVLRNELFISDTKKDSTGLIAVSEAVLENHGSIEQFYRRGFLFCTLLDIFIIKKTNGRMTLRDVLLSMNAAYPPGRPFNSDSLFTIVASLTSPDVQEFCQNYLNRNDPLPIQGQFLSLGISYVPKKRHPRVLADFGVVAYKDDRTHRMVIGGILNDAPVSGFKPGDTVLTIDGADFHLDLSCAQIIRRLFFTSPGTGFTAVVNRGGTEQTVRGRTVEYYERHLFYIDDSAGTNARALRKIWASR